ncbi:MAG: hypothetical protein IR527_02315 [Bacteroides sp.]|nr:MAG: hypothetical protein IR527_02315 [Bacteroides sp.]
MNNNINFKLKINYKVYNILIILFTMGICLLFIEYLHDGIKINNLFSNMLINSYYFTIVSLFGIMFYSIQYISMASWSVILLRISHMFMFLYPIFSTILLLVIIYGLFSNILYFNWSNIELLDIKSINYDLIIAQKNIFLNKKFFIVRIILYLLFWFFFIFKINQINNFCQKYNKINYFNINLKYSAMFCFVFGFTFPLFAIDVIMSLEPHWFSTIFGWYNLSLLWISGLSFITILTILVKYNNDCFAFNENHLNDLATYIFAFSIFWVYILISQNLLIWYSNIPEEIIWYQTRWLGGYYKLYIINIIMNFMVPFFFLIRKQFRRNYKIVSLVCISLILGHWLDIYIMISPGVIGKFYKIGLVEIGMFMMFFSMFFILILKKLEKIDIYTKKHPYLSNSIKHEI